MATTTGTPRRDEGRPGSTPTAGDVKNKAHDLASGAADKAKEMGSSMADTAKQAASSAAGTVGEWTSAAGEKADDATSAVGGGMRSLGGTIREKAPQGGMLGGAASRLADTLESGGRYLQQEGLSGMGEDLTNLVRRNPLPALLISAGLGFLLGRALRS